MDENTAENDRNGAPVYVRFGPKPNQEVPLPWAEGMLAWIKETHPYVFGGALTHVMGIDGMRAPARERT
jgi:hypothetical protein